MKFNKPNIAIVGATGAVGRELLTLLRERKFPYGELKLVASSRSAGTKIEFSGRKLPVENLSTFDFSQTDIAFFSAGTSVSREWATHAAAQGALVIDNTNAFRMDPQTPLVVPQVNSKRLSARPSSGIVANPNCSTIQMVRTLDRIRSRFGLKRVIVSTYQAASGGGLAGMGELRNDLRLELSGLESNQPSIKFPRPLGFNVVPQIDVFLDSGYTLEEQKMRQETRKILEMPALEVTATAVRVPVMNGHSESVYVETEADLDLMEVQEAIASGDSIELHAVAQNFPTPRFEGNGNQVHVGRVRLDPDRNDALWMWIVANNLRVGAALNALQIAEVITLNAQEAA